MSRKTLKDIRDISDEEINKLTYKELREYTSSLADVVNKRVTRFQEANEKSTSFSDFMESGGKMSVKGKNLNQLRREFTRGRNFINDETSSLSTWRPVKNTIITELQQRGVDIDNESFYRFFDVYKKLKKEDSSVTDRQFKYAVMQDIVDRVSEEPKTVDEVVADIMSQLSSIYERNKERQTSIDISDMFEY